MGSSLKSKLSAIASPAADKPTRVRHPLSVHRFEQTLDERLLALDPVALARIGFSGDWPGIEKCLFLDTETTGLSRGAGTIAFLVGIGYVRDGLFVVEQQLLGDYPDEPLLMNGLRRMLPEFKVIISFNGNAFDLPLLESRAVMCRMGTLFDEHQKLDLMFPSRRLWKRRLGSCRLSELERRVLASGRENDLPGSEAPARFFRYLETGDRTLLDEVLLHNRLDILSLGTLLARLCVDYAAPEKLEEQIDLFSMGRALERCGEGLVAERCYRLAHLPEANLSLSMLRKRAGDARESEALWSELAGRGEMGARPLIELSKLYEHKTRDFEKAHACALEAWKIEPDPATERRIRRITRKIQIRQEDA